MCDLAEWIKSVNVIRYMEALPWVEKGIITWGVRVYKRRFDETRLLEWAEKRKYNVFCKEVIERMV